MILTLNSIILNTKKRTSKAFVLSWIGRNVCWRPFANHRAISSYPIGLWFPVWEWEWPHDGSLLKWTFSIQLLPRHADPCELTNCINKCICWNLIQKEIMIFDNNQLLYLDRGWTMPSASSISNKSRFSSSEPSQMWMYDGWHRYTSWSRKDNTWNVVKNKNKKVFLSWILYLLYILNNRKWFHLLW